MKENSPEKNSRLRSADATHFNYICVNRIYHNIFIIKATNRMKRNITGNSMSLKGAMQKTTLVLLALVCSFGTYANGRLEKTVAKGTNSTPAELKLLTERSKEKLLKKIKLKAFRVLTLLSKERAQVQPQTQQELTHFLYLKAALRWYSVL